MTKEQAIEMCKQKWWIGKTSKEIVDFQLYEPLLCMDFSDFHKALEVVLKRPVYTHEFADAKSLKEEYEGKREYQGLTESIERIIPKDKPVILI